MAARRPFWKWHRWKSIGFCLWPPSTCIWNLKLKFQSKLDLCSGNHVVYRQTDRRTDGRTRWIQYTPPPTSGIKSMADSRFVPSQWEMALLCNNISHWLGANLELALEELMVLAISKHSTGYEIMDHFMYAPSQWETTLQCKIVSHWPGRLHRLNPA